MNTKRPDNESDNVTEDAKHVADKHDVADDKDVAGERGVTVDKDVADDEDVAVKDAVEYCDLPDYEEDVRSVNKKRGRPKKCTSKVTRVPQYLQEGRSRWSRIS